ncbi:MAG TPA: aldo/keto reductase [Stellaceae bacterium]|nr:aldo/keto reductase [Stellaceae bacterium]
MRQISMPNGERVPALGMGTWGMGEARTSGTDMVAALKLGLDLGMTLIDTAEMYGEGGAEKVVGRAIYGRRDEVYLVSKVYPHNAGRKDAVAACERSLKRLGTDRLDLYLLHWRGEVPLTETLEAFTALERAGKIRAWGVSNFDTADMKELRRLPGGKGCASNQVLYNLTRRGIEWDLLPWCREHRLPIMAYSPIEQGRLLTHPALRRLATARGVTPAQLVLSWVLHQTGVIAIPKAASPEHLRENRAALDLTLSPAELAALDEAFPPPKRKEPLAML